MNYCIFIQQTEQTDCTTNRLYNKQTVQQTDCIWVGGQVNKELRYLSCVLEF